MSGTDAKLGAPQGIVLREATGPPGLPLGGPRSPRLRDFLQTLHETIRALERRYEEERKVAEATTRANFAVVLDEVLEHVYEAFRPLIPYERIDLDLIEDEGRFVRARWSRSESGDRGPRSSEAVPMAAHPLRGLLETGRPSLLDGSAEAGGAGPHSAVACPLVAMGKPVGFLTFSAPGPGVYDEGHVEVLGQLAPQISVIVEKGRMYEDLQRSYARLQAEVRERARTERALREAQAELEAANRVLATLAATDGLTGVANRRAFDDALAREWRRAVRGDLPLALVLIDIDAFKAFNDAHGHLVGDDCLRTVARALQDSVNRPCDLVARYGGEEFAVLLPETSRGPALMLAERMREVVEALGVAHGASPVGAVVTASLGVSSLSPRIGDDPDALVRDADRALYRAKQGGRNRASAAGE